VLVEVVAPGAGVGLSVPGVLWVLWVVWTFAVLGVPGVRGSGSTFGPMPADRADGFVVGVEPRVPGEAEYGSASQKAGPSNGDRLELAEG
jgi:hypothetical protein